MCGRAVRPSTRRCARRRSPSLPAAQVETPLSLVFHPNPKQSSWSSKNNSSCGLWCWDALAPLCLGTLLSHRSLGCSWRLQDWDPPSPRMGGGGIQALLLRFPHGRGAFCLHQSPLRPCWGGTRGRVAPPSPTDLPWHGFRVTADVRGDTGTEGCNALKARCNQLEEKILLIVCFHS